MKENWSEQLCNFSLPEEEWLQVSAAEQVQSQYPDKDVKCSCGDYDTGCLYTEVTVTEYPSGAGQFVPRAADTVQSP